MDEERRLTDAEVEESIRFAAGVSAAAGHPVDRVEVHEDARRALRGEITFDEAVARAVARAKEGVMDDEEPEVDADLGQRLLANKELMERIAHARKHPEERVRRTGRPERRRMADGGSDETS